MTDVVRINATLNLVASVTYLGMQDAVDGQAALARRDTPRRPGHASPARHLPARHDAALVVSDFEGGTARSTPSNARRGWFSS